MKTIAALIAIISLVSGSAWADYYGSMNFHSTVHLNCKSLNDDFFVLGVCSNTSTGTPLHLEEDCEISALAEGTRVQWEWEGIFTVTHRAPSDFVSLQTFSLDSEDSPDSPDLIARFLVHITADKTGSFEATMDHLNLQCGE